MTIGKNLKRLLFFTIGGAISFIAVILFIAYTYCFINASHSVHPPLQAFLYVLKNKPPALFTSYDFLLISALIGSIIGFFIGVIENIVRNWDKHSVFVQAICIILLMCFIVGPLTILFRYVLALFGINFLPIVEQLIQQLFAVIFIVIFVTIKKLWPEIGLNLPNKWVDKRLLLFPACYIFVNIMHNKIIAPLNIILFIALLECFLIGFEEEVLYRGIFLELFKKYSILSRVFLSSIIFGFSHLGGPTLYSIQQSVYATFIGIGFAAVRLRTRTIAPLILIHALINFTGALGNYDVLVNVNYGRNIDLSSTFQNIIVFLPLALYGLFILRKKIRVNLESNPAV